VLATGVEASRIVTDITSVEVDAVGAAVPGAEAGQDDPPQLSRSRDRTVSNLLFIALLRLWRPFGGDDSAKG
jgi:hypothetical protein